MNNFTWEQTKNYFSPIEMIEIRPNYFVPKNEVKYNRHGLPKLRGGDIMGAFKEKRSEYSGPFKDREFWV